MKMKKALVALVCAIALVTATFLGTMAYFTSQDSVTNTFTVGKVEIKLDEENVDKKDAQGNDNSNELRDHANDYHLIPGQKYVKDPTVTVIKDSEDSYVRVFMTLTRSSQWDTICAKYTVGEGADAHQLGINDFIEGYDENLWIYKGNKENGDNTRTYEFWYHDVVTKNGENMLEVTHDTDENTVLPALFKKLVMPGVLTNADMALLTAEASETNPAFKIDVVAHAIQAAGFADAEAAWDAWN